MIVTGIKSQTRVIDPIDDARWDALIDTHPRATVFHSSAWLSVLRDSYGYQAFAMVIENEDGSLTAGAPFCFIQSRLTGTRLVSVPFCDYVPPLAVSSEECEQLLGAIQAHAELRRGVAFTQLRWGELPDVQAEQEGWHVSDAYANYVVDLTGTGEDLERGIHSSAKRAVRKAEREGLTIEIATGLEAVRSFYDMNVLTRRKHGIFPQPWRFFEALHRNLLAQGKGFLVIARAEGRPIAADLVLCSRDTAFYKYNASDPCFLHLRPNNLVLWHALNESKRRGMKAFDLGRAQQQDEGLRRFKLLWGAQEHPLPYYTYPPSDGAAGGEQGRAYRLAAPVLRRMPTGVLRLMGRVLYRHVG